MIPPGWPLDPAARRWPRSVVALHLHSTLASYMTASEGPSCSEEECIPSRQSCIANKQVEPRHLRRRDQCLRISELESLSHFRCRCRQVKLDVLSPGATLQEDVEPSYHPDLDRNRFVVMLADADSSRETVAAHLKEQAPRGVLVSKRELNIYGTADSPKPRLNRLSLNSPSPRWKFSSAILLGCMRRSWRGGGHDPRRFDVA